VLTSPARSAPSIECWARTRSTSASISKGSATDAPENTPAFIDPRLRRWRTTARVSMPAIPTMCWRTSSSSSVPVARQLDARGDGSRTAYPATQILSPRLSASSPFQPVLPICGAVATTIWR
jgi:hypothetical protein